VLGTPPQLAKDPPDDLGLCEGIGRPLDEQHWDRDPVQVLVADSFRLARRVERVAQEH
jgi:hypothetical protein